MNSVRCDGGNCPSKTNCKRYTERTEDFIRAALWARREAGDSACTLYMPVRIISTFRGE